MQNFGRVALAVIAASLVAIGCNPFAPKCRETRVTVEEVPGDPFYGILDTAYYERIGYTCRSDGAIRNALGVQIGTRYVCTKCT